MTFDVWTQLNLTHLDNFWVIHLDNYPCRQFLSFQAFSSASPNAWALVLGTAGETRKRKEGEGQKGQGEITEEREECKSIEKKKWKEKYLKFEDSDLDHLYTFLLLAYHQADCQCRDQNFGEVFQSAFKKWKQKTFENLLFLAVNFTFLVLKCGRLIT